MEVDRTALKCQDQSASVKPSRKPFPSNLDRDHVEWSGSGSSQNVDPSDLPGQTTQTPNSVFKVHLDGTGCVLGSFPDRDPGGVHPPFLTQQSKWDWDGIGRRSEEGRTSGSGSR